MKSFLTLLKIHSSLLKRLVHGAHHPSDSIALRMRPTFGGSFDSGDSFTTYLELRSRGSENLAAVQLPQALERVQCTVSTRTLR